MKEKLNLGCGKRLLYDYVNIDSTPFKGVVVMDVRKLDYPDGSVSEILAEFILEHISFFETQETILEWWRVLKPAGILELWVPDFKAIAQAYLHGEIDRNHLHYQLYCPMVTPGKQMPHLCTFDRPYLEKLLTEEGFEIVSMENIGTDLKVIAKKLVSKEGTCR